MLRVYLLWRVAKGFKKGNADGAVYEAQVACVVKGGVIEPNDCDLGSAPRELLFREVFANEI